MRSIESFHLKEKVVFRSTKTTLTVDNVDSGKGGGSQRIHVLKRVDQDDLNSNMGTPRGTSRSFDVLIFGILMLQGNRDNIDSMAGGSQKILNQVLKLIDQHDLYGSVAYPKKHQQKDISDIYLLPFATRGIFTNVALQEPFGLTVIEVRHSSRHALVVVGYAWQP